VVTINNLSLTDIVILFKFATDLVLILPKLQRWRMQGSTADDSGGNDAARTNRQQQIESTHPNSEWTLFGLGCICGGVAVAASLYALRVRKDANQIRRDAATISSLTTDLRVSLEKCKFAVDSENEMRAAVRMIPNQILEYNNKLFQDLRKYQADVNSSSNKLTDALSSPSVRGMWGEMQLKRTVELIGMSRFCDFELQPSLDNGSRPDMVIKLTNHRCIVVDSKVPLTAFQNALACNDGAKKEEYLRSHALAVRTHIKALSSKQYPSRGMKKHPQLQHFESPSFVVLFMPSETLYSVALEYDPGLLEYASLSNVCIASPTTLMALLKLVDSGWQRDEVNANSHEIAQVGKDLYARVGTVVGHLGAVGRSLDKAVGHYNDATVSMESRLLPSVKKLAKFSTQKTMGDLPLIHTRSHSAGEVGVSDSADISPAVHNESTHSV
jgi:DNA recombination protein RmuC